MSCNSPYATAALPTPTTSPTPSPTTTPSPSPTASPTSATTSLPSPSEPDRPVTLRIATWNVQGLVRADRLSAILQDLADVGVHVALIQETNLLPGDAPGSKLNHLQIPDDWVLAVPSKGVTSSNRGKGIAILLHPALTSTSRATKTPAPVLKLVSEVVNESFELLAAQICNTTVVNVYVHANVTPDYDALRSAIGGIPGFASRNVVVGGDFNHPHRRHTLETEVMMPLGLVPAYDPEHPPATHRRNNPLDLVFYKGDDICASPVQVSTASLSDHYVVATDVTGTTIESLIAPVAPPRMIMWDRLPDKPYYLLSDEEKAHFADFVKDCTNAVSDASSADDPVSSMTEALLSVAARHLGTKEYRTKARTVWWNKGLSKLHKRMRRAHKRTLQTNHPTERLQRYDREYKAVKAKYTKACDQARRRCLTSFQRKFRPTDMNRTWQSTTHQRGKRHPRYLRHAAGDPDTSCEFWSGIFSESRFPPVEPPQPTSTDVEFLNTSRVNDAIAEMEDVTPGQDGLRTRLLTFLSHTTAASYIADGLNRACNNTLSHQAKSSVTVLIKKPKATGTDPAGYRPIALQPVMAKLLSKCVEMQLWEQVEDGSVHLSNSQAGFRPCRSRYDLITLLRCAQEQYHPKGRTPTNSPPRQIFSAFLHITKAYDSVPHSKIIERLQEAGVKEHLVRVVSDLLSNRTTVIYGRTVPIGRGVPQGDPLSPLLFIIMLQPLSDALAAHPAGGVTLPGDLMIKDLLYADDISLLAESPEDLNRVLAVCQEWATENGFEFSVDKSKAMVLAGLDPPDLPSVEMYGQPLEWVKQFKYLGFPVYANNKYRKCLPLDLQSVYQVIGPMASVLHPDSMASLPLIQRVQAFSTMVEGKAMHNAQVADLDVKAIDVYTNKGLKAITGLISATHLRCDLGVLPAELVVHRNAMYYLWHLRRRVWYRHYLPQLLHLEPVSRLTSMVLQYEGLSLRDVDSLGQDQWKAAVKEAVLQRAESYYDTTDFQHLALYPFLQPYQFAYRGQQYLNCSSTVDLAQVAIELRHDRLSGVQSPWEHHPCVCCGAPGGLNGSHLLQCQSLPTNLLSERSQLITEFSPELSLADFAARTIACTADLSTELSLTDPRTVFLCKSLRLGRKVMRYARAAFAALEGGDLVSSQGSEPGLPEISADTTDNLRAPQLNTAITSCSLQSLQATTA